MGKNMKAYAALALSMTLAGSSVVVSKILVQQFPIFLASGCSLLIALVVLIPLCLGLYGFNLSLNGHTAFIFFLQSLTGTFLFRVLLFFGLKHTSAIAAGLITSSAPVLVGLLAYLVLHEELFWNKVMGIMLTVGGIVIINITGVSGGYANSLLGNCLVLLAVMGEALFSIFSKLTDDQIPPLQKTTIICFFAWLCFIPFSIYDLLHFNMYPIDYRVWLSLIYYGLGITVLAFVLWFKGIAHTPASTSAVFSGFMPLSSVLLSILILKESVSLWHGISLLLIIAGIISTISPAALISLKTAGKAGRQKRESVDLNHL